MVRSHAQGGPAQEGEFVAIGIGVTSEQDRDVPGIRGERFLDRAPRRRSGGDLGGVDHHHVGEHVAAEGDVTGAFVAEQSDVQVRHRRAQPPDEGHREEQIGEVVRGEQQQSRTGPHGPGQREGLAGRRSVLGRPGAPEQTTQKRRSHDVPDRSEPRPKRDGKLSVHPGTVKSRLADRGSVEGTGERDLPGLFDASDRMEGDRLEHFLG